jgi:hypothetical protein
MILDIILILLFLIVVYAGYKAGFLTTFLKMASGISGIIIALCLTQPVTNLAVNNGWNDSLENKIYNNVISSEAFDAYIEGGKGVEGLNNLLKELGVPGFVSEFVAEGIVDSFNPQEIAQSISEGIGYIVTLVVVFFALLIFSSLFFSILKIFVKSFRKAVGLVRIADGVLGIAFYSLMLVVVLYIVFFVLALIMKNASLDSEFFIFISDQLHLEDDKFGIAKYFYENNIITKFFALLF